MRPILALLRSDGGIAAVEFALIAPILAILLLGATDIALAVSAKLALQQSAARSIEMVNVSGLNGVALDGLQAEAATAAGVTSQNVTIDKWLECDGVRQSDFNTDCVSGSQIGRYVGLTINGSYLPLFGIGFKSLGLTQNGVVPLTGSASVRLQ